MNIPPLENARLAELNPQLDQALALALAARQAAERGDHQAAQRLRAEHDAIFAALNEQP